jgi:hypothetical protein
MAIDCQDPRVGICRHLHHCGVEVGDPRNQCPEEACISPCAYKLCYIAQTVVCGGENVWLSTVKRYAVEDIGYELLCMLSKLPKCARW